MIGKDRIFQAYYTKSTPIVSYMVDLLKLKGNEIIFEPCAGDGVFIDSILDLHKDISIEAFELNIDAYQKLQDKYYNYGNIKIKQTDTLTDIDLEFACSTEEGMYDAVIANPPYGAWRNTEERKKLKKRFNGFYAKESYSLFLYRSIESLKEGGKLVFIIPDTYLNLNMHKAIRECILTKTKINEIALFPSSYFPGVNFGYANLSIIALEKCSNETMCLEHTFKLIKGYQSVEELGKKKIKHLTKLNIKQSSILNNEGFIFLTNSNPLITNCIKNTPVTIGNICDCATGFYSGNDKKYLKVLSKTIRNSKRYDLVDKSKITYDDTSKPINGIESSNFFVPIVKGGNVRYFKPDNWFMEWSSDIVNFYKRDKKARYQNSTYYFNKGLAVPMVSSSSITASLIENRLFDQSIVGIFPKDIELLDYLLAFFNSPTCNKLIRTINPSTNNSSNYIKKIPFLRPTQDDLNKISNNIKQIVRQVKSSMNYESNFEEENNQLIEDLYGF